VTTTTSDTETEAQNRLGLGRIGKTKTNKQFWSWIRLLPSLWMRHCFPSKAFI